MLAPNPPQTKVTIVGKNRNLPLGKSCWAVLAHKLLGPRPPLPLLSSHTSLPPRSLLSCMCELKGELSTVLMLKCAAHYQVPAERKQPDCRPHVLDAKGHPLAHGCGSQGCAEVGGAGLLRRELPRAFVLHDQEQRRVGHV